MNDNESRDMTAVQRYNNLKNQEKKIMQEINQNIEILQTDLHALINTLMSVMTLRPVKDQKILQSTFSDIELQMKNINDSKEIIKKFSGVFQSFNSQTSKVLLDVDVNHDKSLQRMAYNSKKLSPELRTESTSTTSSSVMSSSSSTKPTSILIADSNSLMSRFESDCDMEDVQSSKRKKNTRHEVHGGDDVGSNKF